VVLKRAAASSKHLFELPCDIKSRIKWMDLALRRSSRINKKRSRLAPESSYQPGSMAVDVMLFKAQIKETKLVCHTPRRYYHT
jgi:hypothetical protein